MPIGWCIAQINESTRNSVDVIVSLGYLVAAAVLVAVAFWVIRKWVTRAGQEGGVTTGFTLAELRQLHRDGELTDEQFAAAKAALIAHGLAAMGGLGDSNEADSAAGEAGEPNAAGLSDGSITAEGDESSDKSPGDTGPKDGPPGRGG